MTLDDYKNLFKRLLPPGSAFTRNPFSWLAKLIDGLTPEFFRIDQRINDLLRQLDPRTCDEMLTDWERILALPDSCAGQPDTIQGRKAAAFAKYTATGGQSRRYFIDLAAALGFQITINEYFRFTAGSSAGQSLTNDNGWRFSWRINAGTVTYRHFHAGSGAGEPVRSWGNELLECMINKHKPAHTKVFFAYYLGDRHA